MATKVANLKGPTGAIGDTGATGNPGATGSQGVLAISTDSGNTATTGSDAKLWVPSPTKLADTSGAGLLRKISGLTTDFVDGTNNCQDLGSASRPIITAARQQGYNALDNPNFEIDQRWCKTSNPSALGNNASGWVADRWLLSKNSVGGAINWYNQAGFAPWQPYPPTEQICFGFSNVAISVYTVSGALGASEYIMLYQSVEGPRLRPLLGNPSTVTFFINNEGTGTLTFAFSLYGGATTAYSYVSPLISVVPSSTIFTVANIPPFPSAAGWSTAIGNTPGYQFRICLGCGTTYQTSTTGWQAGNYLAPTGIGNFMSNSSNLLAFYLVQHEPGPVFTRALDIPFEQNFRQCQRHYAKSSPLMVKPNAGNWKAVGAYVGSNTVRTGGNLAFPVEMAFVPTMTYYDNSNNPGAVYVDFYGAIGVSSGPANTRSVPNILTVAGCTAGNGSPCLCSWTAATGW